MKGETYGVEYGMTCQALKFWQLRGAYSFLKMNLFADNALP